MVNEDEVLTIKLDDIIPNRFQPREVFDEQALIDLSDSIKQHGVIQPIIVRPIGNKYEIIAGERRYKASVLAGKTDIPAIVKNKDDKDSSIIAYIENSQRKNVSPIEEAKTCERILSSNDMTQEQLAKQLGMSQSTLANKLRLLTLPVEIQDALLHGEISERHARSLLSVKDTKDQLSLLEKIKEKKMTVRELEGEISNMLGNFESMNNEGLYNLPGSEAAQGNGLNFDNYAANPTAPQPIPEVPAPAAAPEVPAQPASQGEFLSFLNDFNDSNIAQSIGTPQQTPVEAPVAPPVENAAPAPQQNQFNDFLSSFDSTGIANNIAQPTPEVPAAPVAPPIEQTNSAFTDFLNKFDDSKVVPTPEVPAVTPESQAAIAPEASPAITPLDAAVPAPETPGTDFNDFIKQYEMPVATPEAPADLGPVAPAEPSNDFEQYLNTTDTTDIANKYLNPIADVVPKQEYVENSPNYVDISKPKSYDSIDSIIEEIKAVTDKVKQSKFKITTDEVNFDDIYQIKITIDKRNFI